MIALNRDATRRLLGLFQLTNHIHIELNENKFYGFDNISVNYFDGKLVTWLNSDIFINSNHIAFTCPCKTTIFVGSD